ncbi:MAG: hypothetical protein AAB495_02005 [Patescibacteria group bacterium]
MFLRLLPDSWIVRFYLRAGAIAGDIASYAACGDDAGAFDRWIKKLAKWEREYVRRGYRTISMSDFQSYGGYGVSLDGKVRAKRDVDEEPIFHAGELLRIVGKLFREKKTSKKAVEK